MSKVKKIAKRTGIGLGVAFVIFVLIGIFAPEPKQSADKQETAQPAKTVAAEPQPTPEPKPAPAPKKQTTMDKLWAALDKSLGSRDGMDIKYDKKAKSAELINYQSTFINTNDTVGTAYRDFVQWGLQIKDIPEVEQIDMKTQTDFTDAYGKTAKEDACEIIMSTKDFKKFNWDNLIGQPIHNQINQNGMLIIHPAIMRDVNLDDIKLLY